MKIALTSFDWNVLGEDLMKFAKLVADFNYFINHSVGSSSLIVGGACQFLPL